MNVLKYIMLDEFTPIIFPERLEHTVVAGPFIHQITSAGFCRIIGAEKDHPDILIGHGVRIDAYGKSTSLQIDSCPQDSGIIQAEIERCLK